ncbi:orf315 (mitochondrion) [Beta vulgaris subsp. vulgaris]|uniref:Orf315 protein n=3 Tax=Beta TaxID=3554 RepID=Q9MFF1_BETVV|nr:orf315 [Beta vulgaris subsp. vulgaris]YP_004222308.1 hypothetical protein LKY74_mgp092 [Beta vulgaris subsp. maritima]YP_004842113.1 hypothetical protein LKY79_mgp093 [Beta macrocarpa]CBJ17535.1 hypothetical protein [Beta vulgaris subsp. maritima]CBX24917.1 hypothetical protein [Beta macrocarpa]BAA99291.1 orf315 [Beta vulgaris subsp. vulgaris]
MCGKFQIKKLYELIRPSAARVHWKRIICNNKASPKSLFITWLGIQNRLYTKDRMANWNLACDPVCVLCGQGAESAQHLFFACEYSQQVWGLFFTLRGFPDDCFYRLSFSMLTGEASFTVGGQKTKVFTYYLIPSLCILQLKCAVVDLADSLITVENRNDEQIIALQEKDVRIQELTEFQGVYKKLNKSESQLELERKGKAALEQEVVKLKEARSQELDAAAKSATSKATEDFCRSEVYADLLFDRYDGGWEACVRCVEDRFPKVIDWAEVDKAFQMDGHILPKDHPRAVGCKLPDYIVANVHPSELPIPPFENKD